MLNRHTGFVVTTADRRPGVGPTHVQVVPPDIFRPGGTKDFQIGTGRMANPLNTK